MPPVMAWSPAGPVSPQFSEVQKSAQRAAAAELREQLLKAAQNGKEEFVIAPGEYRFPDNAGVAFANLGNLKINAAGVTFWFERGDSELTGKTRGLLLEGCRDLTIEGLTIDFDPPLFMQGKVKGFDPVANTIDLTVDDGFPVAEYPPGQMLLYKPDGKIMPQNALFHKGVKVASERELRVTATDGQFHAGNDRPGLRKAFGDRCILNIGDYVALPFRRDPFGAVVLKHCANTTLKNVSIYASSTMGIAEGFGDRNIFDGVKIIRRPGSKRLLACMADTFHSYCDIRGPIIRNCEFAYNCDDFINIYGYFGVVAEKIETNQFLIGTMMGEPLVVGGKLDFFNKDSIAPQGSAVITAVQLTPEDGGVVEAVVKRMGLYRHPGLTAWVVTLDRAVAAAETSLVDIHTHNASGFVVVNNYFHSSMGRALLTSGAHGCLIQSNRWQSLCGGVNIFMESWFSMTGPFPADIVVKNNRFEDILGYASVPTQDAPVQGYIYVGMAPSRNFLRSHIVNRNMEISGNYIENPPATPILVAYTDGVKVLNNVVKNPYHLVGHLGRNPGMNYYTENPASLVCVAVSSNITVSGNTALGPAPFLKAGEYKGIPNKQPPAKPARPNTAP
ncbi:MAG: hypothetical protein NTZ16_13860 [Verrucomicrobia bacterium]|nr:hypothetical protein [Verrucomicrobiota bacterium]